MINKLIKFITSISCIIFSFVSINCTKVNKEISITPSYSHLDSVNSELIEYLENQSYNEELIQFEIPFDNNYGVPFDYDEFYSGYIVEGFDVDNNGRIYFLGGGQKATIACFEGERLIFRRNYGQFWSNDIHVYKDKMYVFDGAENRNNLFVLNFNNGEIENAFKHIIINSVNNYFFLDSTIVLRVFNNEKNISIDTETAYIELDFKGNLISPANGLYNLPKVVTEKIDDKRFLGKWNESYVFYQNRSMDLNELNIIFFLYDLEGRLIQNIQFNSDIFGEDIYGLEGFPQEHKKLKNDKIYLLGKKGNSALISIIHLDKLFQNQN